MVAKSEFRKAMDTAQALPEDVVLGNIVWFRINDGDYSPSDIEDYFTRTGLNPGYLPSDIKPVRAYEKASSCLAGQQHEYPLPGHVFGNVLVREVTRDDMRVVRHIVREVRDSRRVKLHSASVAELIFDKAVRTGGQGVLDQNRTNVRSRLTDDAHQILDPSEVPIINNLLAAFDADYTRRVNNHDGDKVRGVVRNYLGYLNAVMMKDGVYFVHRSRQSDLDALNEFVRLLGNGCSLEQMPIPDLKRLRESVVEAFQVEAEKELTEVVVAIQKLRATRKRVGPDAYAKVRAQYDSVLLKAQEYTRTLHLTQDRTAGAAEVALDALTELHADMMRSA
jgi:hypothetical protein